MNWIKCKLRAWLGVDDVALEAKKMSCDLSNAVNSFNKHINDLEKFSTIDADVNFRGNNTVILTGQYRGRAYVQFYDVPQEDFRRYVEMMKHERRGDVFRAVDAPIGFSGSFSLQTKGKDT